MLDLELPLLSSVLRSNQVQLEKGIRMVLDKAIDASEYLAFLQGRHRRSARIAAGDLIEHLLGRAAS